MTESQRRNKNEKERARYANRTPSEVAARKAYMRRQGILYRSNLSPERKAARSARNKANWKNLSPEQKKQKLAERADWEKTSLKGIARAKAREEKRIQRHLRCIENRRNSARDVWRRKTPVERALDNARRRERYRSLPEVRERIKSQTRAWAKKNLEKLVCRNHRRRAMKLSIGGKHSASEWMELKARYGNRCAMCGRQEPDIKLTRDHIVPIIRGGSDWITNIQPLCRSCNSVKGTALPAHLEPRTEEETGEVDEEG